jgi:hypoxanthine phosphoribosyltransferase
MTYDKDIQEILYTPQDIDERVRGLAKQIQTDYWDKDLSIVSILNGAVVFTTDLMRYLHLRITLDFIGASSYKDGTRSKDLIFTKELYSNINNRHVLLIDDILDTGNTIFQVKSKLEKEFPLSVKTCVLFDKPSRRVQNVEADYVAYTIGDYFIVGYGLDFAEKYRNLPYVGLLRKEKYEL